MFFPTEKSNDHIMFWTEWTISFSSWDFFLTINLDG